MATRTKTSIYIDPQLLKSVKRVALDLDTNQTEAIEEGLRLWLGRQTHEAGTDTSAGRVIEGTNTNKAKIKGKPGAPPDASGSTDRDNIDLTATGIRKAIETIIQAYAAARRTAVDADELERAVAMIVRIYASGNRVVIDAIERNLNAFDSLTEMLAAVETIDRDPESGVDLSQLPPEFVAAYYRAGGYETDVPRPGKRSRGTDPKRRTG